jgi:type I restriction enzyme S subunit
MIPTGWSRFKLRDVVRRIKDGGTPPREDESNFGGGINWIVIDDIKDKIFFTKDTLSEKGLKNSSAVLWNEGTVILSTGATIGEVGITYVKACTKQGISGIEVDEEKLYNEYLKYFLQLSRPRLKSLAQGSTIKEVRPSILLDIDIALPTKLSEQSAIARILSTVDKAIEKTEQLIAKYERIKTGLMQDLLTKGIDEQGRIRSESTHRFKDSLLGRIPVEWEVNELQYVVKREKPITYGIVQPGKFDQNGVLLIRGQDYIDGWVPQSAFFRVTRQLHNQYQRSTTIKNDVLVCIVGATTGAVAIVPEWIEEANITQTTARICCESDVIRPRFALYFLRSEYGRKQVRRYIKGSAQPGLNLGDLQRFVIFTPSPLEQDLIIERLDSLSQCGTAQGAILGKLMKLKAGLLQDLLSGRVRVPEEMIEQMQKETEMAPR